MKSVNGNVPDQNGNIKVETANEAKIKETVLNIFFPVGSIYMSAVSEFNPNTAWGGTWQKIENRFLLGSSASKVVGATGGEENVVLTEAQMPSHNHGVGTIESTGSALSPHTRDYTDDSVIYGAFHKFQDVLSKTSDASFRDEYQNIRWDFMFSRTSTGGTLWTGNTQPHNNMPPYQVVNVWKRTA